MKILLSNLIIRIYRCIAVCSILLKKFVWIIVILSLLFLLFYYFDLFFLLSCSDLVKQKEAIISVIIQLTPVYPEIIIEDIELIKPDNKFHLDLDKSFIRYYFFDNSNFLFSDFFSPFKNSRYYSNKRIMYYCYSLNSKTWNNLVFLHNLEYNFLLAKKNEILDLMWKNQLLLNSSINNIPPIETILETYNKRYLSKQIRFLDKYSFLDFENSQEAINYIIEKEKYNSLDTNVLTLLFNRSLNYKNIVICTDLKFHYTKVLADYNFQLKRERNIIINMNMTGFINNSFRSIKMITEEL